MKQRSEGFGYEDDGDKVKNAVSPPCQCQRSREPSLVSVWHR